MSDVRKPTKPKSRKLYCSLTYDGIGGYDDICCINKDVRRIGCFSPKNKNIGCICSGNPDKYTIFVMARYPRAK